MDLPYALKLLLAANEQPYGFIKLYGVRADYEVRNMTEFGLVEATLNDGQPGSFTSINRITDLGETFLRTFANGSIPEPALVAQDSSDEWQSTPALNLVEKWKMNFVTGLSALGQ